VSLSVALAGVGWRTAEHYFALRCSCRPGFGGGELCEPHSMAVGSMGAEQRRYNKPHAPLRQRGGEGAEVVVVGKARSRELGEALETGGRLFAA
jgi:hypothetical protein